jgi:hypothetical protein
MDAGELLAMLRAKGVRLWLEGHRPKLDPAEKLTAEDWSAIRGGRAALIELLRAENAPPPEDLRPPVPPPGAVVMMADENGRATGRASECFMWCWLGGPEWIYASRFPPPYSRVEAR